MNVAELNATEALKPGADLWVIKNDSQSKWWQELDFRSGFLLSKCLFHHRRPMSTKVNEILEITEFPKSQFLNNSTHLLVGSSDHFANKWILLWQDDPNQTEDAIHEISQSLKFKSVRLFSDSEALLKKFKARSKSSLDDITFIENT